MQEQTAASKGLLALLVMILCTALMFCGLDLGKKPKNEMYATEDRPAVSERRKAIFINYLEFGKMIKGKTLVEFKSEAEEAVGKISALGLNTIILHVRSHCDAFYESEIFPYSYQLSGKQGAGCGFDPLSEFLSICRGKNIKVEAWINPYRVATGSDGLSGLADENPANGFDAEKQELIVLDTGTYLNPSCEKSTELIVSGVEELLSKYDVDGIHFDDYFYPSNDEKTDNLLYEKYKTDKSQDISVGDFRRGCVNSMIKRVYEKVKEHNAVFGISPAADIEKNREVLFADAEEWCRGGYCDYICPQIYFGFEYPKEGFDFLSLCKRWREICGETELDIALAAYKIGTTDGGSDEWKEHDDILKRQAEYVKNAGAGLCIYGFSTLFSDSKQSAAELENLKNSSF